MIVDFFDSACREPERLTEQFGIQDNEDGSKAFTTLLNELEWNARVENPARIPVTFTAIDGCIISYRRNGELERSCDGMLTYDENIVFIELKNVRTAWIENGLDQLISTITTFSELHNLAGIKHKRAFLCNRRHRKFEVLDAEQKRRFFDKYRVRINISATIKI